MLNNKKCLNSLIIGIVWILLFDTDLWIEWISLIVMIPNQAAK
jgi:hypothetical protein